MKLRLSFSGESLRYLAPRILAFDSSLNFLPIPDVLIFLRVSSDIFVPNILCLHFSLNSSDILRPLHHDVPANIAFVVNAIFIPHHAKTYFWESFTLIPWRAAQYSLGSSCDVRLPIPHDLRS